MNGWSDSAPPAPVCTVEARPEPLVVLSEPPVAGSTLEIVLDTLRSAITWKPARTVCGLSTFQLASVCSPFENTERAAVCETPSNSRSPIGSGV